MLKELIEHIVKHLVEKSDQVSISERIESGKTILEIAVDAQDRGRVIGKEGQTIRAIRMMIGAITPIDKEIQVVLAE